MYCMVCNYLSMPVKKSICLVKSILIKMHPKPAMCNKKYDMHCWRDLPNLKYKMSTNLLIYKLWWLPWKWPLLVSEGDVPHPEQHFKFFSFIFFIQLSCLKWNSPAKYFYRIEAWTKSQGSSRYLWIYFSQWICIILSKLNWVLFPGIQMTMCRYCFR